MKIELMPGGGQIHVSGQRGNAPKPPNAEVIHIPERMIDSLCKVLRFDENDSVYMRSLIKRHEDGDATLPERILVHVIPRLAFGCVVITFE